MTKPEDLEAESESFPYIDWLTIGASLIFFDFFGAEQIIVVNFSIAILRISILTQGKKAK